MVGNPSITLTNDGTGMTGDKFVVQKNVKRDGRWDTVCGLAKHYQNRNDASARIVNLQVSERENRTRYIYCGGG